MALYVVGNHTHNLAQRYAKKLNCAALTYTPTHFADTELALSFNQSPDLSDADVLLIHQCDGAKDINAQLFELLMVTTHLRMHNVRTIIGLLPYLPYARQTKIICHTLASTPLFHALLTNAGINTIIAADIHEHTNQVTGMQLGTSINCASWWAEIIRNNFNNEINEGRLCLVAPDKGAQPYVETLANMLSLPSAVVTKERLKQDHATAISIEGIVHGMHALIIDDIVDTGHTAVGACNLLLGHKAHAVSACFTHAVLSPGALDHLTCSPLKHIFLTNTLCQRPLVHPHVTYTDIHDFLAAQVATHLATLLPKE
ncbi:MAG: ribose-phosphate diphosphokinase [Candidatus Babeliales bacterium]|jgi:ribose-phosphate pyrophosphokinase